MKKGILKQEKEMKGKKSTGNTRFELKHIQKCHKHMKCQTKCGQVFI